MPTFREQRRVAVFAAVLATLVSDLGSGARAQETFISEFAASGSTTLVDEDGDETDWIEIHHTGTSPLDLTSWYLTDDAEDLLKWQLPAVTVDPGAFLVVFASGKDRAAPGSELHTNFSLDADGEYLALVRPDGIGVVDAYAPAYPEQRRAVSYGRSRSVGDERYFSPPTPGAPNDAGFVGFVDDTRFSVDRGLYDTPFSVEISTATEGATIRYTTDGSAPNATHGDVYSDPLAIATTTTLRAAAFKGGFLPTNVDTHTYIFLEDVIHQPDDPTGFPDNWGTHRNGNQNFLARADYGMDPRVVNDPQYSPLMIEALESLPSLSIVMDLRDLFDLETGVYSNSLERGAAWERPASVELIYPDGSEGFQLDAGLRAQGGASRRPWTTPKHPLRLLFKEQYGASKLEFPLFGDSAIDRFDTIVLRAGFNDAWTILASDQREPALYVRDQVIRDTHAAMGHAAAHGNFVHLYVNGLYWGLYNPSERPDDSFQASYLGGDKEEYDVLTHRDGQLQSGDRRAWSEMLRIAARGVSSDVAYEELQEYLDVESLIDYMVLNLYAGTLDWPGNNWYAARRRQDGAGFKFFIWDAERCLESVTANRVGVDNSNSPAFLYDKLRAHADFRRHFGDRAHKFLFNDGPLTPEKVQARLEGRLDEVELSILGESARWGDFWREPPYTLNGEWRTEKTRLLTEYFHRRTDIVVQQFRAAGLYPSIVAPTFHQHGGRIPAGFILAARAPAGLVYYTLDGTDPRLPDGELSPSALLAGLSPSSTLLPSGAAARMLVPENGEAGLDWTRVTYDDSSWLPRRTGVGYESTSGFEDLLSSNDEELLRGVNASLYLRVPFVVEDPSALAFLRLRMKYDDGFIAYLNGDRVAARNAPETPVWNSTATSSNFDSDALVFEDIDISDHIASLRAGRNVLAIHGLNLTAASGDMLILPELTFSEKTGTGIVLVRTTLVRARTFLDGDWSALTEALFGVDSSSLRITEIMYHPRDPEGPFEDGALEDSVFEDDDFEYIELQNTGTASLNLAGMRLTSGVEFTFPAGNHDPADDLGPGEFVLVVRNLAAFAARYDTTGLYVAGEYEKALGNGGDRITLVDALGETILDFVYDDWYPQTDGDGHSLEIVDPQSAFESLSESTSWRPSAAIDGSPGEGPAPTAGGRQLPGDSNQDGALDLGDAVHLLIHLFLSSRAGLPCDGETIADGANRILMDLNGDGGVDSSDAVYLLEHLFRRGAPPVLGRECIPIADCPDVCR